MYLVCFISTVNGHCKKEKKPWKTGTSSGHITNLYQSILDFWYLWIRHATNTDHMCSKIPSLPHKLGNITAPKSFPTTGTGPALSAFPFLPRTLSLTSQSTTSSTSDDASLKSVTRYKNELECLSRVRNFHAGIISLTKAKSITIIDISINRLINGSYDVNV